MTYTISAIRACNLLEQKLFQREQIMTIQHIYDEVSLFISLTFK